LHGEHKTRGGKLVVADFEVRDGRLSGVRISGDFFLEPPEALSQITQAVEGAPADVEEEALAARVRDGLSADVEMIGFSPESVAMAVRKALS
jgi:lipoate---protein ligase